MADACESLSERERECLRLVADNRQSKEIARDLGISIRTVNEHCDNARAKLGVANRFEAARLLKTFEASQGLPPYPLTGEPIRVEPMAIPSQEHPATPATSTAGGAVGEAWTPFVHDLLPADPLTALPLSSEGRPQNELTFRERLTAIGWISGRMVFYLVLFVLGAEAFSRIIYKLFHR